MNGKKKKNRKLVLDSGKVCHYLRRDLGLKSFLYGQIFYFKNLIFIFSYFLERIFKRNESQKEDSFQI